MVDKTAIKADSEHLWLWVAIEQKNRQFLALSISKERNTFVVREAYRRFGRDSWKASGFSGWWWNLVSAGLPVPETCTSYPSPI